MFVGDICVITSKSADSWVQESQNLSRSSFLATQAKTVPLLEENRSSPASRVRSARNEPRQSLVVTSDQSTEKRDLRLTPVF